MNALEQLTLQAIEARQAMLAQGSAPRLFYLTAADWAVLDAAGVPMVMKPTRQQAQGCYGTPPERPEAELAGLPAVPSFSTAHSRSRLISNSGRCRYLR